MKRRLNAWDVGWRIGRAHEPRGGDLWVPWDRTAGVIGPQGSGKTLDLLTPALLGAPGAALVTLTKVEDLLLSLTARSTGDRPCVVLDPFGLAAALPRSWCGTRSPGAWTQGGRAPGEGVHGRHRQGRDQRRQRRRRRPLLRRRSRQSPPGLLPRRRPDREDPRRRAALGRQPRRGDRPSRDPAPTPARRTVLARPAPRRPPRRRPDRRQHRHHRPAGDDAVLPSRHPPPLRPRARPDPPPTWPRSSASAAPSTCSAAKTPTPPRPR